MLNRLKFLFAISLLAIPLASCKTELSSHCPALVKYNKATLAKAAEELRTLGFQEPEIGQLVTDYQKLRDACRAIEGQKG